MPWEMAANSGKISLGVRQARTILRDFRPRSSLSNRRLRELPWWPRGAQRFVPVALYLPDLNPGWAVRRAPSAQRVAVTAIESLRRLPSGKTSSPVTPCAGVLDVERAAPRAPRPLDPEEKVLFVPGASSERTASTRPSPAAQWPSQLCEVVHLCGRADESCSQNPQRPVRRSCAAATTSMDTCTTRFPGQWPPPIWRSAARAHPPSASCRRWVCRPSSCPTPTLARTSA